MCRTDKGGLKLKVDGTINRTVCALKSMEGVVHLNVVLLCVLYCEEHTNMG